MCSDLCFGGVWLHHMRGDEDCLIIQALKHPDLPQLFSFTSPHWFQPSSDLGDCLAAGLLNNIEPNPHCLGLILIPDLSLIFHHVCYI
jgi:hypothetical protein